MKREIDAGDCPCHVGNPNAVLSLRIERTTTPCGFIDMWSGVTDSLCQYIHRPTYIHTYIYILYKYM